MGYPNKHHAEVYWTLDQYLERYDTPRARRQAIARWNAHVARNGNVPIIHKCSICSGRELKLDRKHGVWKDKRPTKVERDEMKGIDR
jgi:hypothetical protein